MQCYIHIPFCTSKCKYCRFASFSGISELQLENYVQFLCKEIKNSSPHPSPLSQGTFSGFLFKKSIHLALSGEGNSNKSLSFLQERGLGGKVLSTLYFGGGTPSTLSVTQFSRIFSSLRKNFFFSEDIEITIESTPEKVTPGNLEAWKQLGVTRISIGIQSLNEKTLYEVARYEKGNILKTFEIIEEFFQNNPEIVFNLDFIIGLPYVKKGELARDINWVLENYTFPRHFSVYMLEDYYDVSEEADSRFEEISYPHSWKDLAVAEEDFLGEYLEVRAVLETYSIFPYEISNFAKKIPPLSLSLSKEENTPPLAPPLSVEGDRTREKLKKRGETLYFCKHNWGYWNHEEVVAFGLGASGFENNIRYKNSENFLEYYTKKGRTKENLTTEDIRIEKIMFGIRTFSLEKKYLETEALEKINTLEQEGLIENREEYIRLTDDGIVKMDYVLGEII